MQESFDSPEHSKKKKRKMNVKLLPWVLLLLVLAAGAGGTMYYKNRADKVESDPTAVQKEKNQAETDRVLTALKSTILVTETDAPTVARVEDPAKLKESNETFYKDIQQGDYLVIFPKRAIIYRESNDQIINVAPIINTSDLKAEEGTQPAETVAPSNKNTN